MSPTVAVVAHRKKTLGAGLDRLRTLITEQDVGDLLWFEVPKSKKAPKKVRKALKKGADLVFVWGGDGMVQRCADELATSGVPMAILPAGTANLFANNLGIPIDLEEAVRIGFHGRRGEARPGRAQRRATSR
ncbi:diacylglycerol/lipid kinase family protein [Nonomuraea roseola]|uniref:diacylglycerol/lipid kinase family protein n=1 Tax=Nonomuraea roseola TaxID=46179 RepID=UPI0031F8723D